MPQSIARVPVHIVYSTKNRKPWLDSSDLRDELYAYKATLLKNNVDSPAIIIGGVEDHIHVLCLLSRKFAIMKVVEEAKKETTKWLKRRDKRFSDFAWQSGYGIFGVSESNIPQVKRYIENQAEHHNQISFQDEYRVLCKKHGIELDERYAWD
jgi:REP element-mobilizing transposase RayT